MIVLRRLLKCSAGAGAVMAGLVAVAPAQAAVVPYFFNGNCIDCAAAAGTGAFAVTALLLVSDYTPGTDLNDSHFVSFKYDGSNLLDPYLVTINGEPGVPAVNWTHQFTSMTGKLDFDMGFQELHLRFGDGLEFDLNSHGDWFTCGAKDGIYYAVECSWQNNADRGQGAFAQAPIPEPGTYALLALGLAGMAARRRMVAQR